jgi:hypothetical protein
MPSSTFYDLNRAASSTSANLLAGDVNEFVPRLSRVNVYAVASALGMRIQFYADSDIAIDDKEIPYIGTSLDKSAHFIDSFIVMPGTRLTVRLRETAAAATTDTYVSVEVLPM